MHRGWSNIKGVYRTFLVSHLRDQSDEHQTPLRWVAARIVAALLVVASLSSQGQSQNTIRESKTATLRGTVFLRDASGNQSVVAGAHVALTGKASLQSETDANGEFVISAVPYGSYTAEVTCPGLSTVQTVQVAGREIDLSIELKPEQIVSSVVVTADQSEPQNPAPNETIPASTLQDAPNVDDRFESVLPLVPGVVRGPDGHVNLKGARNTQSGALVNSTNVTDPVTGGSAISLPVDVVASVQVVSNPYDPQYGRFTGAVSTVTTKNSDFENFHFSIQNFVPRPRDRDGSIRGIASSTPRMTFTGPLVSDHLAITQSFQYRYVQTPVNSLPPFQRDTRLQSFDSYTQLDYVISSRQTANLSVAFYPQRLNYLGLNTFTTQKSTPDFHQRGYQINFQHTYVNSNSGQLSSLFSYKNYDADITAQSDEPYRVQLETTLGGFFNRQDRQTSRVSWQETYHFAPRKFAGTHHVTAGFSYEHSVYDGRQTFLPVEFDGVGATPVERITFSSPTEFSVTQNETAWFVGDQWALSPRLTLTPGVRFDHDAVTDSTHPAPRVGFLLELTQDGKTLLKGGAGLFYDRVPLNAPTFAELPNRTVSVLDQNGEPISSIAYVNQIDGGLRNPRSTSWNLELDRQILTGFAVRVAYEDRNTTNDFVVSPVSQGSSGSLLLSNRGSDSYRELQFAARYTLGHSVLNASYVRSRAYGDLNDLNQFFGNLAQPVIELDARGRLPFDAPNRFLFWGTIAAPWRLTVVPVFDLHSGFPYSIQDQYRAYVGPRNIDSFPRFSSFDLQITRPVVFHFRGRRIPTRIGGGVFNLFNHFDPRDVQNNLASTRFGEFFNSSWREYSGKFVLEF
jgi:outer membrane receptor for ferrienterochelin and colicin